MKSLYQRFLTGHKRSVEARKNIVFSFVLKGISILINLVLVPLTINYLNPVNYGIWLTLTSVIGWFNFFDIGLGNGLRNYFAIALAKEKTNLAKTYVSTTYALVGLISLSLLVVFFLVNPFLDWSKILNTDASNVKEIQQLVYIVVVAFSIQFVVRLINVLFIASQKPALSNLINTIGSLLSLLAVYVLVKTTESSILYLGASISLINLLLPFIFSIIWYKRKFKKYAPSLKYVNFKYTKRLMNTGVKFFIMQAATLIVLATDNMIITQITGPQDVTVYNIAYKYFGLITMVFSIITAPYWSAFTEAYVKKDFKWIKNTTNKVSKLWLLFFVGIIIMIFSADWVYKIWIGKAVTVPSVLNYFMALWVALTTATMIFSNFLSGVNKIKLSLFHSVFVSVVNIPLSIFLAKNMGLGAAGVILASCLCVLPRAVLQPIQYKKIISGNAKGIWNA
jgi:O-antigen/teichoic acid export membrane protein